MIPEEDVLVSIAKAMREKRGNALATAGSRSGETYLDCTECEEGVTIAATGPRADPADVASDFEIRRFIVDHAGCVYLDRYGDNYDDYEDFDDDRSMFADPGGRSALRAATEDNPRNLPCPTCGAENALTPADRARGYQCDRCADRDEGRCY